MTPGDVSINGVGDDRQYTVTGLTDTQTYDSALFDADNVTVSVWVPESRPRGLMQRFGFIDEAAAAWSLVTSAVGDVEAAMCCAGRDGGRC